MFCLLCALRAARRGKGAKHHCLSSLVSPPSSLPPFKLHKHPDSPPPASETPADDEGSEHGAVGANGAREKELPPGMTLEMALTKAQRKNLKKKAKAAKAADDGASTGAASSHTALGGGGGNGGAGSAAGSDVASGSGGGAGAAGGADGLMNSTAFVNDVEAYNRLLNIYMCSDDEDEDDDDDDDEDGGEVYGAQAGGDANGADGSRSDSTTDAAVSSGWTGGAGGGREHAAFDAPAALAPAATHFAPTVPVPAPAPAPAPAAFAAPASALPPGVDRAGAIERLVARMFDAPAFAALAARFLDPREQCALGAAAEADYPELVGLIARGDVGGFEALVAEHAGGGGGALGGAAAVMPAFDSAYGGAALTPALSPSLAPAPPSPAPAAAAAPAFGTVPAFGTLPAPAPGGLYAAAPQTQAPLMQAAPPPLAPAAAVKTVGAYGAYGAAAAVAPVAAAAGAAADDDGDLEDLLALCGVGA